MCVAYYSGHNTWLSACSGMLVALTRIFERGIIRYVRTLTR